MRWTVFSLAAGAALLLFLAGAGVSSQEPAAEAPPRVGVFQRAPVLMAFYRSRYWADTLDGWRRELAAARERGDEETVARLEERGRAAQERAHQQLAGEATLTDVLAPILDELPEIAEEAGVGVVVEHPLWRSPAVEEVDLTLAIVERYPPRDSRSRD